MTSPASAPAPLARRIGRVLLRILLALVALVAAFAAFVYWKSERGMNQRLDVAGEELTIPTDAASVERGRVLASTRGCLECHASDAGGAIPLRAMPVMDVHTPNLTRAGRTASWSGKDWARAVRHGVRPDGSVLLFMPTTDYRFMDANDLGAIVAYLRSLPPVQRDVGRTKVGPVGRLLYVTGELPLVPAERTDHTAPVPAAPPVGPTVEYGRYMAHTCTGCHGEHFSGGKIPGTPPEWPPAANLTPHESGLAGASYDQFVAAVQRGEKRDGGTINPMYMPFRQFAGFTDVEVQALYAFLRTVPARPAGQR